MVPLRRDRESQPTRALRRATHVDFRHGAQIETQDKGWESALGSIGFYSLAFCSSPPHRQSDRHSQCRCLWPWTVPGERGNAWVCREGSSVETQAGAGEFTDRLYSTGANLDPP